MKRITILLFIVFIGCNVYNRESIENYKGWVVEDKGSNAAYEWYAIRNTSTNEIKKVVVEDGLGDVYNYLDTIGKPPSRSALKFIKL